ncbi:MAG: hypothetical protein H6773_03775 [Pseudomonadales bacterium]|nr:hypothetical protein [Candidatus Woesebacteria bacterium]MCB9801276.1 hypothetical protein [Pseudomonadales bacterium]
MTEEHTIVPPETPGIKAQPSQAELDAIAQSYRQEKKMLSVPLIVAMAVLLLLIGGSTFFVLQKRQRSQYEVVPEVMIDSESEEIASDSADQVELSFEDHLFMGTLQEKYPVLYSTTFDTSWKDRGLEYELMSLEDYGELDSLQATYSGIPVHYLDHKLIVLGLKVFDTRATGAAMPILADDYVAIRYDQTEYDAANWREVELKPGESAEVFVPFVLPVNAQDYFVLSGDLRNPFLSPIGTPDAVLPVIVE